MVGPRDIRNLEKPDCRSEYNIHKHWSVKKPEFVHLIFPFKNLVWKAIANLMLTFGQRLTRPAQDAQCEISCLRASIKRREAEVHLAQACFVGWLSL